MTGKVLKLYNKYFRQDIGVIFFITIVNFIVTLFSFSIVLYKLHQFLNNKLNLDDLINIFMFVVSIDINIILLSIFLFYIVSLQKRFSSDNGYVYNYIQLPISKIWTAIYGYIEVVIYSLIQITVYLTLLYFFREFILNILSRIVIKSVNLVSELEFKNILFSYDTQLDRTLNVILFIFLILSIISLIGVILNTLNMNIVNSVIIIISIIFMIFISSIFGFGVNISNEKIRNTIIILLNFNIKVVLILLVNLIAYYIYKNKMDY